MRRINLPESEQSIRRIAVAALMVMLGWGHLHACRAEEQGKHMSTQLPTLEELGKLPPDGGSNYNRLVFEKSPYLLQHAANPVDWYPWGDEAFEQAKATGKPVFLSIGYSTCHWCHVMERESFEDPEVARLMNQAFVNIKVDREERPDIDNVYMTVCQAMTGRGGWPLTIIMTPERKPFFAGTYFPKKGRFGRPGMMELIPQIAQAWREQRGEILTSAEKIIAHVQSLSSDASGTEPGTDTLAGGYNQLASRFDAARGGFGSAPKFPTPHNLSFLLRHWKRTGDARALAMVEKTLQSMRDGGLYDHIGYGFHRYSTDANWLVPHFEKMLYDQAMLTIAYVEAYQATGKEEYAQTVREIIIYVLRDMTSPEGGFYSAEDADSEDVEGKFYLWTRDEIVAVLGQSDGDLFCRVFNVKSGGNFTNPHTPPGTNIPHRTKSPADWARELGVEEHTLRSQLDAFRQKLFDAREKRIHPYKDDKILTDWNGLMIAALAKAGQALDEPRYIVAAQRAADFLLTKLCDKRGSLLKRYRQGEAGLPAHLDDHAFVVWGLLDLYEACFDVRYLEAAIELNRQMLAEFWDDAAGGLFFTANDGETLPMRTKDAYDGAIPSGNSVAMLNLIRLGRITANADLEKRAASIGRAFSNAINGSPSAHTQMLCSLDFGIGPSREIIVVGKPGANDTHRLLQVIRPRFIPNKVVLFRPSATEAPPITRIARFTAAYKSLNGKATAYVCTDYTCQAPTTTPDKLRSLLSGKATTE